MCIWNVDFDCVCMRICNVFLCVWTCVYVWVSVCVCLGVGGQVLCGKYLEIPGKNSTVETFEKEPEPVKEVCSLYG